MSETEPFLYTQAWAADWARRNFGHEFWTTRERALRFFEEATELAVACGVGDTALNRTIRHVCSQPPGEEEKEIGDVCFTLDVLSEIMGLNTSAARTMAYDKAAAKDETYWRERHQNKIDLGLTQ